MFTTKMTTSFTSPVFYVLNCPFLVSLTNPLNVACCWTHIFIYIIHYFHLSLLPLHEKIKYTKSAHQKKKKTHYHHTHILYCIVESFFIVFFNLISPMFRQGFFFSFVLIHCLFINIVYYFFFQIFLMN